MSNLNEARYLGARDVAKRLNVSMTTVYRLLQRGDFPQALKFGRLTRWDVNMIDDWAAKQAAQV